LHPETPEEGMSLEALFGGRIKDLDAAQKRLKQVARDLGLPLSDRKMTYNSRLAQELGKWAEAQRKGDAFHDAMFRAYFVDCLNIGKVDELVKLAKSLGLPEQEARSVLEQRTYKAAVDADWARSREMGVSAVPTFMVDGQAVEGAQSYEVLERLFISCGVKKR
jgi:predicted DsbA family dithiol-disulfide isomerase